MRDLVAPHLEMLVGRLNGPLAFRFILQPLVAASFAARAGIADVRAGLPPYGWAVLARLRRSGELLREAWAHVGKVFIAAVIVDVIYELIVFRWVSPVQALIVAFVLAILPYPPIRGAVNRAVRIWRGRLTRS